MARVSSAQGCGDHVRTGLVLHAGGDRARRDDFGWLASLRRGGAECHILSSDIWRHVRDCGRMTSVEGAASGKVGIPHFSCCQGAASRRKLQRARSAPFGVQDRSENNGSDSLDGWSSTSKCAEGMKNELIMAILRHRVERELEPQVVLEAITGRSVSPYSRRFGTAVNVQAKVDSRAAR